MITNTYTQDLSEASAPDEIGQILRNAAQACHEAANECTTAWQDKYAGRPWAKIARILEQAADKCDKVCNH